jgi:hypothetical protein
MGLFDRFKKAKPAPNKESKKSGKKSQDTCTSKSFVVTDDILIAYAQSDPIISAGVQVTVDNVCTGYSFKAKEDNDEATRQIEEADRLFYDDNFLEKIKNLTKSIVILADAYQEKRIWIDQGKTMFKSDVIDTPSMKIKKNDKGELTGYAQEIDGTEKVKFGIDDVVHYTSNIFGSSLEGQSLISAVLYSSALKKFIEKYNGDVFSNFKPRGVWTFPEEMGEEEYDLNVKSIVDNKTKSHKDIFLKGEGIKFTSFDAQKDMDFKNALSEARLEIIVGMLVPPIMLGIPEGSNKASADVELQAFDRRIASLQKAIQYKVDTELLAPLGLDLISFVLDKASKRDEVREIERVTLMKGLVTLNEARKELGLPELDDEEFPEANMIWKDSTNESYPEDTSEESDDSGERSDDAQDLEKSMKFKKKVESEDKPKVHIELNPITDADVNSTLSIFKKWNTKSKSKIREEMSKFTKVIKDPKEVVDAVKATVDWQILAELYSADIVKKYIESGDYAVGKLGRNFTPRADEIEFLKNYNFDLIKSMEDRNTDALTNTLRRNILEGKSTADSTVEVMGIMDKTRVEAERIIRTELNRANSNGALSAMESMGEMNIKKYLLMVDDKVTSDISKIFNKKYGSAEQAIPLEDLFGIIYKGKKIEGKATPLHINDRDTLVFVSD